MNEHGINKKNLLTAFPIALSKDPPALAIADGTAELLTSRLSEIERLRLYTRIDELPEDLLDILAYDFKIDWWDSNYSLEEKRRTLKDSWRVHRTLGTKAAVESAISAIYPNTKVVEWFENGGDPYTFWLRINAANLRTDTERHARIMRRVAYYKNLRSHLDGFIWDYSGEPFVNEPDVLRLHRLMISAAFTYNRNFVPVLFDGSALFDGSIPFGQAAGSMFGLPLFKVSATMPGVDDILRMAGVKWGGITFRNEQRFLLESLRIAFPAFDNRRNFLARYFFDGEINFDGAALFDNVSGSLFGLSAFKIAAMLRNAEDRFRLAGVKYGGVSFTHGEGVGLHSFTASPFAFPEAQTFTLPVLTVGMSIRDLHDTLTAGIRSRYAFREWPGRDSARFDGRRLFDGSTLFDQGVGGILRLGSFRASMGVPHQETAGVERISLSAKMPLKHEHIGGTVTINNWHTFGGEDTFDGARRFDADIKQEVL